MSVDGIQKLERGVTRPYWNTIQRLITALRLSVDEQARLHAAVEAAPRPRPVLSAAEPARHNLPVPLTSLWVENER